MLRAITSEIESLRLRNCQNSSNNMFLEARILISCQTMNNSVNNNILNIFLPSREELLKESIYLNGQQVPLANIQDQFTYELPKSDINLDKLLTLYQTSLNQTPNEIITLSQNPLFQYYQSGSWDASAISD